MVNDFVAFQSQTGFGSKWGGERLCLLGFDADHPEDDLVGLAVEYRRPGQDR